MRRIDPSEQGFRYVLVASAIRDAITDGKLKPGDQLPGIEGMRSHFEVASMTIRRAVGILTKEKVLVCRPGVGTFVAAPPDAADAHNPLAQLARMRENLIAIEKTVTGQLAELRAEIAVLEETLTVRAAAS